VATALHGLLSARYAEEKSFDAFNLDQAMQIGNVVYPDGSSGHFGFDAHFKESTRKGVTQFRYVGNASAASASAVSVPASAAVSVPASARDLFGGAALAAYSPKIASIVESITKAQGMSFVYSRYIKSGVLPLAIALELAGGCRVLADGTLAPLLYSDEDPEGKRKPAFTYVLLTPNKGYSPNFEGLVEYATTFQNAGEAASGSKVKVILGSQVSAEGLDFKCIRELHLLDGWYHLNRIEQIEGRGIRYCSHQLLPPKFRNCLLYLHAVAIPDYETPDLYAYRVAIRKAQQIGKVTRLLKVNAWDCGLHLEANVLKRHYTEATDAQGHDGLRNTKDEEGRSYAIDTGYTSICDYMADCAYTCAIPGPVGAGAAVPEGIDTQTMQPFDVRILLAEAADRLIKLFQKGTLVYPLEFVLDTIYKPVLRDFAVAGLRELLGTRKFRLADGTVGFLILKNKYIVFQPDRVTDTDIPIAYRYGRVMGRLPRTFVLSRPGFFSAVPAAAFPAAATASAASAAASAATAFPATASAATASAASAAAVARPIAPAKAKESLVPTDAALASLGAWVTLLRDYVLTETSVGSLKDRVPPPFPAAALATFNGWRWVFHRFRAVDHVIRIAASWWMDNLWSLRQRNAILSELVLKESLTELEDLVLRSVADSEIIKGELRGFMTIEGDAAVSYCVQDGALGRCASVLQKYIVESIGEPVSLKEDTHDIYGLIAIKEDTSVFKIVNKDTGRAGGAECGTSSNLPGKQETLRKIQGMLRSILPSGHPIRGLLLEDRVLDKDAEETRKKDAVAEQEAVKDRFEKGKESEVDIRHINSLNLKQICSYTEFLLRWLELETPAGTPRFFLSAVEYVRAEEEERKAADKKKPKQKQKGAVKK
jgi:hypothetical protein